MKEIQGKLILVQVSMRFKLARVRVIWSQLYYVIFLNCTSHLLFIYSHGMISSAIYYNGMFDLITLQIQELFIAGGGEDPNLGSERTVELFCGKLLLTHTPHTPPTSCGCTLYRCNSLAPYCALKYYSWNIQPWNILLLCLVTKIAQISQNATPVSLKQPACQKVIYNPVDVRISVSNKLRVW